MEKDLQQAIKLLRSLRSMTNNTGRVTLEYLTPAESLRRSADRLDYEAELVREVDKFLQDH